MAISNKTRKVLWTKTGNRCAMCRQKLVVEETEVDEESIVGDECHIVSEKPDGPRFDPTFPKSKIDTGNNLIVLCKNHHKMVDDQVETYTAKVLRVIKRNHQRWVETKLTQEETIKPIKITRYQSEIPKQLPRVLDGKTLFNLASVCLSMHQDFPGDLTDEETELVGGFIQTVTDWSDISYEMEPVQIVRASKNIMDEMLELDRNGFLVFAGIEKQTIEGGIGGKSNWNALHLSILRKDDPNIVK